MKFVINGNTYTAFDNLSFSPETDLTNNSLPINEFEARLFTNANIQFGQWAELRDDNNNLWARYWLRYAERIGRDDDRQTYIVRIIGQSPLAFLERVRMPAEFYNSTADGCIDEILNYVGTIGQSGEIIDDNVIAQEFESIQIVGFAPEQSARERLQWILMAAGGYVLSYFDTTIHIRKISTSGATLIPITKTFWKPTITHRDYVTKIIVHAYSYTAGTPDTTDKYVTDGTNYWIQTETVIQLANSNAPSGAPENVVEIEGVTLISPSRASTVITNLAAYYFNRVEVDADVIDNAEYKPGDRVTVYTEEDQLYTGYIDHVDFSFGLQARGRLHLTGAQGVDGAKLTILYKWGNTQIASQVYYLPKGYAYSITTEYLDWPMSGHRYIFRPTTATVTGTLTADTTKTVSVEVALDYFSQASNERQLIEDQHTQLVSILNEIYNSESMQIAQVYKGKKKKAKRQMYQMQLDAAYNDQISKAQMAFSMMLEDVDSNENVLHVVSVDSVDYEDSVVYDPDDRTVVIDGGSSGGHDDPERIYLTSIEVVSQPVQLSYDYGEQLDLSGVSVKAYYSNNTSETVTWACTFTPDDGTALNTAGIQNVIVAYVKDGIRKTTSFQISVAESQQVKLSSITVSNLPAKTTYDFNDQLDLTGISVTAHYTDDTSATVTNQCIFSPEDGSTLLTLGTQSVLVTYSEDEITRTTSFNITVNEVDGTIIPAEAYLRSSISYYSNSVALIVGDRAFSNCSQLVEVDLPNVVSVGTSVFAYCYILSSVNLSNCSYVGNSAFYGCSSITSIELQKCSSIGDYAFYNCSLMGSIALPECEVIGDRAFVGCDRLTNISIPNCSVIGERAFSGCKSIYSIETSNVTQLGQSAFASCSNLRSINVSKVGVIPNGAFSSCEMLSSVNIIGASVIEKNAFYSCRHLTTIETSDLLHSIGSSAFCFCGSLTSIYIGNTSVIEENAFFDCDDLTTVTTYSQGITSVKANGFEGCWNLTDIDTDNLEYVGACGFSNCRSLSASVFPKLQYIGANAFYGCSSLTTLSLPVVSTIGYEAFENCYYLSKIYLTGSSVVSGYSRMFEYTPMKSTSPYGEYGSIYVPSSLVDAYKSASGWSAYSDRITAYEEE